MMSKKHISVEKSSQKTMKSSRSVICRICEMINITDNTRVLCPYCGSFYDSKMKAEYNVKTKRKSSANSTIEKSDSDSSEEENSHSGGGFRNFLKSFLNMSKRSNSNPNLVKQAAPRTNLEENLKLEEENYSCEKQLHPFFSIKNKEPNFFKEFKAKFQLDFDQFKDLTSKALESNNFKDATDFYCWNFSKSSNLINLLIIEKPIKAKQSYNKTSSFAENKKLGTIFDFSVDWKYMKEIYLFLQKMVI